MGCISKAGAIHNILNMFDHEAIEDTLELYDNVVSDDKNNDNFKGKDKLRFQWKSATKDHIVKFKERCKWISWDG